jgi:hypothetical protein
MECEERRDIVFWTLPGIKIRSLLVNQCLEFIIFMRVGRGQFKRQIPR